MNHEVASELSTIAIIASKVRIKIIRTFKLIFVFLHRISKADDTVDLFGAQKNIDSSSADKGLQMQVVARNKYLELNAAGPVNQSSNSMALPGGQTIQPGASKIILNTIYNDLEDLKAKFGRFRVFNGKHDAEHWASCLETFLINTYSNVNEICSHFHFFIEESEFSQWFFGLNVSEWSKLKVEFLKKAAEIEFEQRAMAVMKQTEFLEKLKVLKKDDSKFLNQLDKQPITTFLRHKVQLLLLVYPGMPKTYYGQFAVSLLSDDAQSKRFSATVSRKADLSTLISYANYEDSSNNKST